MRSQLTIRNYSYNLFIGYAVCILLSIAWAIFFETLAPLAIPVFIALAFLVLVDYEKIYLLLFLCIPFSTEFFITDHLATDLPTEPLIAGLMLLYFITSLLNPDRINIKYIKHPLSLLLLTHLAWIAITTFTSSAMMFSAKFLLAKIWYIVTFFYFAEHFIKSEKKIHFILWLIAIPLAIATSKVILHHFTLDFGFKSINEACPPFFRNHVNYAAILTVFMPFVWYLRKWSLGGARRIMEIVFFILLFGIITAYTRAAYVALAALPFAYWVIRLNLTKLAALVATIGLVGIVLYLVIGSKFMELVPNEQTIAHTELSDIVSSTSELKDVSTMERYYRWIAASQMIVAKPIIGFGPGNFYGFYKYYTIDRFSTYVSDNPEKSGVHNYFLMVASEQGIIGLIIFLLLIYLVILYGERVYHRVQNRQQKDLVMAAILSSIVIDMFLLMNDMIETDKIGSFFFFNIAIIVLIDLFNPKDSEEKRVEQNTTSV